MLSHTEENYLKALLQLSLKTPGEQVVGTNELASHLLLKPATVTDMLKKLKDKKLVDYKKYGKIRLSASGRKLAVNIVRKHRLWETFLFDKLGFTWDEVHDVAEQLEHIQSQKLIDWLDVLLDYPQFDPHGDVIPPAGGDLNASFRRTLQEVEVGKTCRMVAVQDNSAGFLQYVGKLGLAINNEIVVRSREPYDAMLTIDVAGSQSRITQKFAEQILVICPLCEVGQPCVSVKCQLH